MEPILYSILTLIVTNTLTFLISFHVNRRRNRIFWAHTIEKDFGNINKHISIIITALMNSNGMGERFKEEYYKEMENVKKEDEIINRAYNTSFTGFDFKQTNETP